MKETDEGFNVTFDEMIEQVTRLENLSVSLVNTKWLSRLKKKNDYAYVLKQGYILKKFKNTEQFFETLGLSKCTIYFKINLYKLIKKYPHLKNPHLSVQYFKDNFKMMKLLCKENGNEFRLKD